MPSGRFGARVGGLWLGTVNGGSDNRRRDAEVQTTITASEAEGRTTGARPHFPGPDLVNGRGCSECSGLGLRHSEGSGLGPGSGLAIDFNAYSDAGPEPKSVLARNPNLTSAAGLTHATHAH